MNFGIVLPVLVLVMGALFIRLGIRLWSRDMDAARWANIALLWLIVGSVFLSALALINEVRRVGESSDGVFTLNSLSVLLLPGIVLFSALAALLWLRRNIQTAYHGTVLLNDDTTQLAWSSAYSCASGGHSRSSTPA